MTNDEVNRKIAELRKAEIINTRDNRTNETVPGKPPAYTDDWKLAGMLLEELVAKYPISILKMDDGEYWVADHMEKFNGFEHSITEAIARAWLAWKE